MSIDTDTALAKFIGCFLGRIPAKGLHNPGFLGTLTVKTGILVRLVNIVEISSSSILSSMHTKVVSCSQPDLEFIICHSSIALTID